MFYDLVPSFDICNANKDDGLTKDELHAPECQGFIQSVGGEVDFADQTFDDFDVDGNGVVSIQEFLNTALMMINGA